jgi:hypothetical protein
VRTVATACPPPPPPLVTNSVTLAVGTLCASVSPLRGENPRDASFFLARSRSSLGFVCQLSNCPPSVRPSPGQKGGHHRPQGSVAHAQTREAAGPGRGPQTLPQFFQAVHH